MSTLDQALSAARASFSAGEPFAHCHGWRGLCAFARFGYFFGSRIAARNFSRATRGSIFIVNGHRSLRDCGLPKFPTLAGWRLLVISRCRDRLWSFLVGDRGVVAPVAVR